MDEPRFTPPRWASALRRWLLRTPGLQRWLGRSTALLTFRGRRSGRLFTTPVAYIRDGDRVLVTADVRRQWWRNLAEQPQVHVRLAGVQHHGRARVLQGLEALDGYLTYLGDGETEPRQARAELAHTVVVAIDLGSLLTRLPVVVNDRG